MLFFAVLVESFAVIGEQDDEVADDGIGIGDRAVVVIRVFAEERLGRFIGGVRIVEMQEEEERLCALPVEPWLRGLQRLAAFSLDAPKGGAVAADLLRGILEEVESVDDARFAPQNECRNSRSRGISGLLQQFGD